jgi:hypothetical protein
MISTPLFAHGRLLAVQYRGETPRIERGGLVFFDAACTEILAVESGVNTFVKGGLDLAASQFGGTTTTPAVYMALGSNNATPTVNDTALTSENTGGTATRLLVTPVPTGGGSGALVYTATWSPSQNVGFITGEVGLLTASTAGTLATHYAFATPFPAKDSSTSLTIAYTVTFGVPS